MDSFVNSHWKSLVNSVVMSLANTLVSSLAYSPANSTVISLATSLVRYLLKSLVEHIGNCNEFSVNPPMEPRVNSQVKSLVYSLVNYLVTSLMHSLVQSLVDHLVNFLVARRLPDVLKHLLQLLEGNPSSWKIRAELRECEERLCDLFSVVQVHYLVQIFVREQPVLHRELLRRIAIKLRLTSGFYA